MGGNTNGQAAAAAQVNQFFGNLNSQGYSGKDGTANVAMDAYGAGSSALYTGLATAAGEVGKLPGPIGYTGIAVNVVVGVAASGTSTSPTCSVVGVIAGTVAGIGAAAISASP